MADNQVVHRERARAEDREPDWSTLMARAIDDITRIIQSEIRLLNVGLKSIFEEQIDRVLAFVTTGALMAGGAICVFAAVIFFLHEYMRLPWWQSFGIIGVALFALAIGFGSFARRSGPGAVT